MNAHPIRFHGGPSNLNSGKCLSTHHINAPLPRARTGGGIRVLSIGSDPRNKASTLNGRICGGACFFQDFDIFRTVKSKDAIQGLAALAQESRLAIFRILVKRGPEGYTPTQLGEKLNVSPPTLSFHLKELQAAGLIDVRRESRFLITGRISPT